MMAELSDNENASWRDDGRQIQPTLPEFASASTTEVWSGRE